MFSEMDDLTIFFLVVLALFIVLLIWHELIKSATKSKQVIANLELQNKLLVKLLEKNGVPKEEINEMISGEQTEAESKQPV